MKIKYKNTIKKITAVILAVTMMPISDFGNTVVAGENITNETEEKAFPTTVQKGLKDLNITSDLVLDKDMEVDNVIHDRGVIDLNGHVLKVNGSYKGQNGIIKINGGSLYCSGNLEIGRYQRIIMNNANDYLNVEGSTIIDGSSYYGGDITNGTIETAGDFTINSNLFRPSGYSKIVLSGNHMQTVNINSHAELNIVELKNYSSEGISSASPINCKTLIRNGSILNVCGEEGSYGYTLEEDIIIDGEYVLISDTLNLNGHTMTVKGDFIQMGGCVDVNKGSLIVEGDYRVQSRIKADDEYSYGMSAGILRMTDNADHVIVNRNFITSSSCSGREYLTAGTLELKGDFIVNTEYSRYSFTASDMHKVLLSGNGKQTVNFDICYQGCSAIANLEIENHSEEGVVITGKPCVTGNVNDNGCKVTGSIVPDSAVTFTNNTYHGDLYIYSYVNLEGNYNIDGNVYSQSSVMLSGNLNITGDYTETGSGIIRMNGGSLKIGGNFNASTTYNSSESIDMTGETDYILVNGNFTMKSPCRSCRITNGTLEVKGDFKADAFYAQGSHRVLLSGDSIQHVSLGDNSYFATLEILNHSEEGVYCERAVVKSTLIRNGCRLRYGDTEGEFGWTLSEDYTYEGDLVLIDETLDLNGHTLTVKGDFIQQAGEVKINGGALFTEGSFRMQTRKGSKGDYTYTSGAGILNMTNESDLVIVNGSYINSSAADHKDYMTAGVLEVRGDFEVNNSGSNSGRNFYSTGSHKVILNGVGTQKIVWAYQNNYTSKIANLEIAGSGVRQINIEGMPYVTGNVNDDNAAITGYIIPGAQTTFSGNSFNGSLRLREPLNVTSELNIEGDVYNDGGRIVMNSGSLTIGGNCDMYNSSYGIEMSHSDDYILVNGNFNFNPYYTSTLSDGILEIKGNFTSTRGFSGCRNHKVILSGSKKQMVNMGSSCTMAVLELNNKSEEGIYAETLIIKDELIRNGCNITYKDAEGEFGWTLSDDEEYDGDLVLVDGTLNLRGHTLTVKGDFIQIGGKADINGGTLIVEGDYRQQNRSGSKGKYTYSQSTAILSMTKPSDTVIIKGDYITNSTADHRSYMTDGLLEVRGNLNVSANSNYNFYPSDSHTLVFNGSKEQTIKIGIYGWNYSGINNLIINNTSDKKVIFENNIYVRGNVEDISGNVEGNISLTDKTRFENGKFSGGIVVSTGVNFSGKAEVAGNINISSALTISGELTVNGDCEMGSSSSLVMNGGTFTILGSLSQSGIYSSGISMAHDSDYISVMKDFSYTPYYNGVFSAGTLEVKGDFHSTQFYASGTHKVILGGDGLQTVDIGSNNYFNIVELKNYSNEGVYSETVFRKNRIIRNGCRISYGEGNTVSGSTLSDDYVCEGDFILTDGVMDLNGHTMTVTGDFIESDGELLFNGGKLVIEGDYRLQNRVKSGEEYTYSAGLGKITMNNSEDIMVVNGDFIIEPVSENCCNITAGTLEVKGDVKQNGNYGFNGGQGLTLTLSGTDIQTVSTYRMVTLGTIVNNNSSSLIINGEIKALENLTDNGGNISGSGSVSVDRVDKITENRWSGSVKITGENTLISDMNIGGTLYIDGNMNLGGHTLQAGAVNITKQVEMNGGSISCSGSFAVGIYGRLIMNSPEDYILSGGDFSFVSCYSHDGLLSDGTLEIRGNFMQDSYRNFIATANHKVILSRKNSSTGRAFIQSVAFNCYAGDTRFNRLVLKKVAGEYQFHNDINLIANEVVYEIDDTVPPTPVTELTATCMSSTKVSLAFGGAADDSGISGYEIYRNGVKTAVTSKNVYTDTSVKPGLTYEYKVYPFDVYYNRSKESPTALVTMPEDTESPSEPEGLKMVSRTGSSINISWNPSSDNVKTEGYEIYRNGEKAADCKKNSYKDGGLEKDKSYIYSIRAYDAAGNMSEFSKEITFSTVSPDIKEVYPEDNAIIGGSLIKLQVKFADNGNSTGNKVNIEYENESGNWVQIPPTYLGQSRYNASTFISSYVWNTEDIKPGEKCEIKYTLYDADGSSDTKTVTYTIDNVPPELPEKFSAKPDNNTIRLKWTPSASADCRSYILLRAEDGKDDYKEIAKLSDRYSDSYTDRNVTEGKQYRYALRVADTFENVSGYIYSEEVTADEDKSAPEVKSILPADNKINGTKTIVAKAEDNVKVEYIRFMIRSAEESQYQELDTIKAVSDRASYSLDTTRYQDGAYYINAVAIDGNGNESIEEYFKKFVIDNTGLSRTESVEAVPYATYATVKWKDVKDTDFGYFQVEMLKDGEFVPVATETKRLFADVNGLLPETSYTFRVVGYDAIGNRGQESEEVNIVTTADTTSPVIKCVSPVSSHYSVLISLSQMTEDNLGVEKGVFSYSYDGENYNEIGEVYTDEKKKQEEINIDFDISVLAEGTIYIKFQAYDTAENKSEDVVNTYVVDRTAPEVVKNPVEISCNGVAGISWDAPKEDDVDYYIIYRMEKDTGIFRKIEEKCTSIGYYDMNVGCGESYRYKICAVDTAGNVSRMSDEVAVTISDDMEAPTVKKIVPSDGSTIGKNQTIKVPVIDNDKIRSVTLEYKGSSKDDIWHTIAADYVNDMIKCCEFTWNTEGLKEGKYSLRAWAEDVSGNISSPYEVTYTLDMTAPEPPEISAKTGYFQVQLNISKPVDKDFSHFEIYRKNVGSTNFEFIGDTIGASDDKSYIDKSVEPYDNYEYKVRSYDMYGNYSESNTVIGNADDIDTIKPVARFSETTMGMTGMEVSFDGSGSTDNSRVTEYTWDFGDGTPKEHGAQVRHVYKEVGTYIVKLTVADAHGNVAYTVGTVVIYDKDAEVGTVEIRFEEEDGCQLPYTIAHFNRGNNDKFTQFADCNGELHMTTEEGMYEMAVYVKGYMPMTTTFTVSRYKENKIVVRLKKGEMIKSEITARKMEIWDILNMGVDLENEANYNEVSYSVTLWFAETPIPVTVEYTGAPGGGGSKELRVFNSNCTDKQQGSGGYTDYTIKIKEHEDERTLICLGVSQTISWLKDMYYVNLSVSNMAEPEFYIKDVIVELELPKELGLAYISDKFNDKFNKENGFLFNQEEYTSELLCSGDTLSYDWVVSGTKPGNFNIGARLMGCLMPVDIRLNERLSAECEIQVNSGEGLIMNIMAENAAYNGEFYYIYFTLINKSSNTFYNLEFSFEDKDGLEKTKQKFYLKDNDSAVPVVSAQDMIQVGVMKPGTELHGVYTTVLDTENEDTYFQFVKSLASTWEAENMGIKVFFNTIPSHSSRSIVEYEDLSMSYYGDPVDVTRGAFTDSKELMALNGFSTLSLDLEYDSGSRYTQSKGEAGYGWSTNYESYIEEHNGIITFHPSPSESAVFISKRAIDENKNPFKYNEEIVYEDETYGEYLCENKDMYDYNLTKNHDGTYIIYAPSKERYYYNESGKLTEIMDSSGRCVSLSYGMNQKIVTDDVSGMRMKLNYNTQGLLTSIEDDNGRHAYIIYDENDCIASVTDESGYTMSYAYDEYRRIIKEKNNTGDIILKNEYDDEGYICRQVTATGQDTHYTYKKDEETKLRYVTINTDGAISSVTVDTANHIIEETNANGSCTSYTYDSHGNQTCEKDNYGNAVMKRYDSSGNIIELYDTFANCTKYNYDEKGNVTRIESPDGKIAKYEYNKNNLVTKSTDASGKVTTYKYDENGQLIEETVEGLGSAHYRYQNGRMVSATDYMGNTTLTQYDGMGNVIKKTDPVGAVTSYSYDNSGRIKSVTDALGNTTTYEYDKNGNKKSETDAQGNVIKYEYDLAGNNTKIIDAYGTETTYEYDKNGNNIKTTYADGSKDIFRYDSVNNITYRKLADGTENKYKYDALNQIINETDADGNQTHYEYYPNGKVYKVQYSDGQSELYTYNSRWQNTCVTDQDGNTTSYTYDEYGNVTTTTNPLGYQQKNEYDKFGRMTSSTDANGNTTCYKYDAAGKCTSVTYPDGSVTGYEYDGAGRTLKEIRYADGTETVTASYTYDLLGRQTSVTDAEGVTQYTEYDYRGNVVSISDSESIKIQENKYDATGKLILTIDGEGRKTEYEYTKTGKVSRASENPDTKEEKTTLYGYDTAGRINKVTDAINGVSKCTYDTTGRISSVKEPEGGVTKYKYDTRGRIIKEINAVGGEKTYTYNTNGTLKQEVNGRKQNTLYKYDAAGRVIKRTDNAGKKNEYTVEYTYDNVGNILTVDDGKGVIIRTYDCMNRVTSYTDYKGNTVKYAYDESGNLISLTYPGGEIVRYTYYENGKPQTVTDYKGRKTTYVYDKNGRLSVISRPDGSSETYTYDRQGRIRTQKDKKASGEVIHEYRYTYDTSGNITQIKGTDNSTALSKMETAVMEYDAANRLIKYNGKEVKYDADGNMTYGPLNGRMVHMEYDSRNRLVKAGNTEYEYDAEDVRTAVQTPEYREEYVTDNEGTLSQVLTATRYKSCGDGIYSTEGTDTKYVYGNGLISEEYRNIMPVSQGETEEGISGGTEQDVAEDKEIYLLHHYNNMGSTTQVTDIDGNVVAEYVYGTYGEADKVSGDESINSRYLYNGMYGVSTDENGLYYMRTRYYNVGIKRFINADIEKGDISNGQSLNRYCYVQGNPVSFTDPFGLSPAFNLESFAHGVLDFLGCFPVIGTIADITQAVMYANEGDTFNMSLCIISAVASGVAWVGKLGVKCGKLAKATKYISTGARLIENAAVFTVSAGQAAETARGMWKKYAEDKQPVGAETLGEVATLGLSIFAAGTSAKSFGMNGNKLKSMAVKEKLGGKKYRNILNVGAGDNPIPCATNIDIDPYASGVIFGDANDLRQFSTGQFDHVIAMNPYKYNLLDSDVPRVLKVDGIMSVTGNYSNKYFKKIYNASSEELSQRGFEVVSKGNAASAFMKYGGKATGGYERTKGKPLQIILKKVGGQ